MKKNLIILPTNLPWEWSTDYINQTALYLSKQNIVVCFFWYDAISLKEYFLQKKRIRPMYTILPNLYVYQSIHILPFRRFAFIRNSNLYLNFFILYLFTKILSIKYHLQQSIVWIFDPRLTQVALLFKSQKFFLLYDCVDYWIGSAWNTQEKVELKRDEKKLLRVSDFVVVNSRVLQKLHQKTRREVALVPQGFRLDSFVSRKGELSISLPYGKPILGYIGGINYRLDFSLIKQLATRNLAWNFVFVGPTQEVGGNFILRRSKLSFQRLLKYPNFYYYPNISKNQIPLVINRFAIGIIPYLSKLLWNKYSYPMKVFEYFYMGKPVVATPIEELKRFPEYVKIGSTASEWERHINDLLFRPWPREVQRAERRLAEENSWEKKIDDIFSYLD